MQVNRLCNGVEQLVQRFLCLPVTFLHPLLDDRCICQQFFGTRLDLGEVPLVRGPGGEICVVARVNLRRLLQNGVKIFAEDGRFTRIKFRYSWFGEKFLHAPSGIIHALEVRLHLQRILFALLSGATRFDFDLRCSNQRGSGIESPGAGEIGA